VKPVAPAVPRRTAPSWTRRLLARVLVGAIASLCIAAGEDEEEPLPYPDDDRRDPSNPGGERYGEDLERQFDGYPVDPGEPGDLYYDPTLENRAYAPGWTGAFVSVGGLGGLATLRAPFLSEASPAPAYGGFLSLCTVSALFEAQLTFWHSEHQARFQQLEDVSLIRNTLSASVGVHPFFFWLISGGRSNYTTADFTAFVGPSVDFVSIQGDTLDLNYHPLGYHLGARIDTYLDSPHNGGAVWLGLEYRYNVTSGSGVDERLRGERAEQHLIALRISWRQNGLLIGNDMLAH
jgi:hypothetical protein